VATTLPLEVFTQRNFVADFYREKLNFTGKSSKIAFLCNPLVDLGVMYTVHLCLIGKCVVDFLLVLIELFSLAITVEVLSLDIGRNRCVRKGVGTHDDDKYRASITSYG